MGALQSDTLNKSKVLAMSESDIMLSKEVEKEVRLSAPTIWRMQKAGLFPRYFKLSPKKNAAHRAEIAEWKRDPQEWAKRKSAGAVA
ncbi:helix-turn-helix transcriptional regulator [Bradyrhizobium sp. USDA 4506]